MSSGAINVDHILQHQWLPFPSTSGWELYSENSFLIIEQANRNLKVEFLCDRSDFVQKQESSSTQSLTQPLISSSNQGIKNQQPK